MLAVDNTSLSWLRITSVHKKVYVSLVEDKWPWGNLRHGITIHSCLWISGVVWSCFSFHLYVSSWDWAWVARSTQQPSLSTEPSLPHTHLNLEFAAGLAATPFYDLKVYHLSFLSPQNLHHNPQRGHFGILGTRWKDMVRIVRDHFTSLPSYRESGGSWFPSNSKRACCFETVKAKCSWKQHVYSILPRSRVTHTYLPLPSSRVKFYLHPVFALGAC